MSRRALKAEKSRIIDRESAEKHAYSVRSVTWRMKMNIPKRIRPNSLISSAVMISPATNVIPSRAQPDAMMLSSWPAVLRPCVSVTSTLW
ncbi:MAG: hypothetical protein ACFHWZ_01540 [Phycisphaerales bacterium]